jgi:hypothetical protein
MVPRPDRRHVRIAPHGHPRVRRPARLLVVALGLASVAMLTGCQIRAVPGLSSKNFTYCTIMADPPRESAKQIVAPGRFRCDGHGADSIALEVILQKQDSKLKWHDVVSDDFVAKGTATSKSKSESARTRRVSIPCTTGKYRTLIHAVEKSKGKSKKVDNASVTVPNPCSHSFLGPS